MVHAEEFMKRKFLKSPRLYLKRHSQKLRKALEGGGHREAPLLSLFILLSVQKLKSYLKTGARPPLPYRGEETDPSGGGEGG
jgi:hypothetical protein